MNAKKNFVILSFIFFSICFPATFGSLQVERKENLVDCKQFTSENGHCVMIYNPSVEQCVVNVYNEIYDSIPLLEGKASTQSVNELHRGIFEENQKIELYVVLSPQGDIPMKVYIQQYTGKRFQCLLKCSDLCYEIPSHTLSIALNSAFFYSIFETFKYPYSSMPVYVPMNLCLSLLVTTCAGVLLHDSDKDRLCRQDMGKLRVVCMTLVSPIVYSKVCFRKILDWITSLCRKGPRKEIEYFPCCPYTYKDEDYFGEERKYIEASL